MLDFVACIFVVFNYRCAGRARQSCQLSRCYGGWYGSGNRLVGQFPQDLELAHREYVAVTTFPYHHNECGELSNYAVNSQPLCSE